MWCVCSDACAYCACVVGCCLMNCVLAFCGEEWEERGSWKEQGAGVMQCCCTVAVFLCTYNPATLRFASDLGRAFNKCSKDRVVCVCVNVCMGSQFCLRFAVLQFTQADVDVLPACFWYRLHRLRGKLACRSPCASPLTFCIPRNCI